MGSSEAGRNLRNGFSAVLKHISSIADSEAHKHRIFERLMKRYFQKDPLYGELFSNVWLLSEWAARSAIGSCS